MRFCTDRRTPIGCLFSHGMTRACISYQKDGTPCSTGYGLMAKSSNSRRSPTLSRSGKIGKVG
jgi:hypothetical protein